MAYFEWARLQITPRMMVIRRRRVDLGARPVYDQLNEYSRSQSRQGQRKEGRGDAGTWVLINQGWMLTYLCGRLRVSTRKTALAARGNEFTQDGCMEMARGCW